MENPVYGWLDAWKEVTICQLLAGLKADCALPREFKDAIRSANIPCNKAITGKVFEGTARTNATQRGIGFLIAPQFHKVIRNYPGPLNPARFLFQVYQAYCKGGAYKPEHVVGVISRAWVTFPSLVRECHLRHLLADVLSTESFMVPLNTLFSAIDASEELDVRYKCDLRVAFKNVHVWSYMNTKRGIRNQYDKVTGQREGVIPMGIHLMLPLNLSWAEPYCEWYLHPRDDVRDVLRLWEAHKVWDYESFITELNEGQGSKMIQELKVVRVTKPPKFKPFLLNLTKI